MPDPGPHPIAANTTAEMPEPLTPERELETHHLLAAGNHGDLVAHAKRIKDRMMENLLNFHAPLSLAEALALNDYTLQEEVELLVTLARNTEDPKTQLSASKTLRALTLDIMKNSGMIVDTRMRSQATDAHGNVIEGERSLRSITSSSHTMLLEAQKGATHAESQENHGEAPGESRLAHYIKEPDDPKAPRGLCSTPLVTRDPSSDDALGVGGTLGGTLEGTPDSSDAPAVPTGSP